MDVRMLEDRRRRGASTTSASASTEDNLLSIYN
jgi:hypothetical protein